MDETMWKKLFEDIKAHKEDVHRDYLEARIVYDAKMRKMNDIEQLLEHRYKEWQRLDQQELMQTKTS